MAYGNCPEAKRLDAIAGIDVVSAVSNAPCGRRSEDEDSVERKGARIPRKTGTERLDSSSVLRRKEGKNRLERKRL